MPFITTISRGIHFGTAELVKNDKAATIAMSNRLGDGQFEVIRKNLNITGRDEHVPAVKIFVRTVKERVRAIANQLPFEIYLRWLILEMVLNVILWMNCFADKDGIHKKFPKTIITGS